MLPKNTRFGRFRQTPGVWRDAPFARTLAAFGAGLQAMGRFLAMKLAIDFPVPLEIHQDQQFLHVPPEVGVGLDDFRRDEVPPVMLYIPTWKNAGLLKL